MNCAPVFNPIADAYDGWYDATEGSAIFHEEAACLRLLGNFSGAWLEVGVGTGRFAEALGVAHGVDLSPQMALKAARRGVRVCAGRAEQLPFPARMFDGVLLALTLCFLDTPEKALRECARVLRENGRLILGTVPADSPWGRTYTRKAAEGHPIYAHARFLTATETVRLVEKAGFQFRRGCSALFWSPGHPPAGRPRVKSGIVPEAGFVGLLFDVHPAGEPAVPVNGG